MRVMFAWELGLHLGHLTRLVPVATQLKRDGHPVLIASRDLAAAAQVLGPAGVPFVQAPHLPAGIPLAHRPTGYADILLSQGWSNRSTLWGLVQGWLNLFQMFKSDKVVLDYSPTAMIAARIAGIPTLSVGNGFELPPLTDPLPVFPNFSWADPEKAAQSERLAVANVNSVLQAYKCSPVSALCELLAGPRLLSTYPDLDHYGTRDDGEYIGPLLGARGAEAISWPDAEGPKVFAYIRRDTSHALDILAALSRLPIRVVCTTSGFTHEELNPFAKSHIRFSSQPVDLRANLDADLCITYGAEGTLLTFLRAGVPQLISPWHVEAFMLGRRVQQSGLGYSIESPGPDSVIENAIWTAASDTNAKTLARSFASCASRLDPSRAAGRVVDEILSSGMSARSIQVPAVPKIFPSEIPVI